jgi:hypothetical protein
MVDYFPSTQDVMDYVKSQLVQPEISSSEKIHNKAAEPPKQTEALSISLYTSNIVHSPSPAERDRTDIKDLPWALLWQIYKVKVCIIFFAVTTHIYACLILLYP